MAVNAIQGAADDLARATKELATLVASISDVLVEADALAGVLSTIKACAVEQVPGTFQVEPKDAEVEIIIGKNITFSAVGGSGNYGANLSGAAASGLKLEKFLQESGFGVSFRVTAEKTKAEPGEAKIVIRDSSLGNKHEAKIVVKPAPVDLAKIAEELKTAKFKFKLQGGEFEVENAEVAKDERVVQVTLKVVKPPTKTVIEKDLIDALESEKKAKDGDFKITIKNFAAIKDTLTIADPNGAVFRGITDSGGVTADDRRKLVQAALCLTKSNPVDGENDIDGTWGPRTEKAVRLFQEATNAAKKEGALTVSERDVLLAADANAIRARCMTTALGVYQAFMDEITSQSLAVKDTPNLTVTVAEATMDASVPGKVTFKLSRSGDGGANLQPDVIMARMKATLLEAASSDDFWIGPNQIILETE